MKSTTASTLAVATCAIIAAVTSTPAAYASSSQSGGTSRVAQTATMRFTYDAAVAAAHGFDVRVDPQGFEYAVPAGTPTDSMAGATPKVPTTPAASLVADETSSGDCGTAFLSFTSTTHFATGYNIFPQWGFAIGHTWNVAVSSSIDAQSFNLDGVAPPLSQNWQGDRDIDVQAIPGQLLSGLAGGTSQTVLGECVAASPTDSIVY